MATQDTMHVATGRRGTGVPTKMRLFACKKACINVYSIKGYCSYNQ